MSWILITGAAQNLGKVICKTLAKDQPIVLHYRSQKEEAEQLQKAFANIQIIQGDFSTREGVEDFCQRYLRKYKETKAVIHNVGNFLSGSLSDIPLDDWYELFQTNLHAPFHITQKLLSSLKKNQGQLLNIGIAGLDLRAEIHMPAYMMTKLCLWKMTRSWAKELAKHHVRVNMVSPGYIENSIDAPKDLPMERFAKAEEVARVVAFFLDEKSSYITGQNIEVAGGVRL